MINRKRSAIFRNVRLAANFLIIVLPIASLSGLGLLATFYSEKAKIFLICVSVLVSIAVILSRSIQKRENAIEVTEYLNTEGLGEVSNNWSNSEVTLWNQQKETIANLLAKDNTWNSVYKYHAYAIACDIAEFYNKKSPYEVNAIELLIASEELSRRYRKILRNRLPFVEQAKISTILNTITMYQSYSPYVTVASDAYGAVMTVVKPFISPSRAVADFIQGKVSNDVSNEITGKIEHQIKLTLLEEIAAVSIDLYSGRFLVANDELGISSGLESDEKSKNLPLEPIRVAIIGQVSSGKSTLTNIICKDTLAETDIMQSTDDMVVYSAVIDGDEKIRIIDLAGLDGSDKANQITLNEVLKSDIVLWALRANQSARKNDAIIREQIKAHYLDNPQYKSPRIVGVITQVDKLTSTSNFSEVETMSDLVDETTIKNIIKYNIDQLVLDDAVLISTKDGKTIGLDRLEAVFVKYLWDAQQTQLNRRRIEASDTSLYQQFNRILKSSKAVLGAIYSDD